MDGTIILWNTITYQKIITFNICIGIITSVCFSPDCNNLTARSVVGTFLLWDTVTYQKITTLTGYPKWASSICFQPEQYDYLLK